MHREPCSPGAAFHAWCPVPFYPELGFADNLRSPCVVPEGGGVWQNAVDPGERNYCTFVTVLRPLIQKLAKTWPYHRRGAFQRCPEPRLKTMFVRLASRSLTRIKSNDRGREKPDALWHSSYPWHPEPHFIGKACGFFIRSRGLPSTARIVGVAARDGFFPQSTAGSPSPCVPHFTRSLALPCMTKGFPTRSWGL